MDPMAFGFGALVAKWTFRLWFRDSLFADVGIDLSDLVKGRVTDFLEARRTVRQFEQLSELVARRVEPFLDSEFGGLPRNELEAAILAAQATLETGLLNASSAIEIDLDPASFEAMLRDHDPERPKICFLSERATALYDVLLAEASSCAMRVASQFPNFEQSATREILSRETQLIGLAESILENLPAPRVPTSWGGGTEDERFATKYLGLVVPRADQLQLFGVQKPGPRRPYSLSVAYISLSASQPSSGESPSVLPVEVSVPAEGSHVALDSEDDHVLRVEAALGDHQRVILAGGAGSGKTTLLQWLAVNACKQTFSGGLERWNEAIPFFIALRRYVGKALPRPEEFLDSDYAAIAGTMPDGWVHRVLDEGRGLVLVDGLDELPEEERAAALSWLTDLIQAFPNSSFIVSSRPLAVSSGWFEIPEARYTELLPMQRHDIRAFVSHWHAAARQFALDDSEVGALRVAERQMLATVNDVPAVRTLCNSPLLCALVCALHRDRVNKLPENRMDLYATALRMLVAARDADRELEVSPASRLTYEHREALLEDFALWLHEAGASDAPIETYDRRVASKLRSLTGVGLESDEVSNFLLARSGVLRQPIEGRVDFVHRTFLEYLAAHALVQDEAIEKLVLHAHLDQWREVVIMAAGHATKAARERLITALVDRGKQEPSNTHRLFLLAVACMETSPVLDESIVGLLNDCLDEILPPTNMTEAAAVASAGTLAVSRLAHFKGLAAHTAACVRALTLIGTEEALEGLRNFRADPRVTVTRQLIRGWGQFDAERYATMVLAESSLDNGHLVITDPEHLNHLEVLKYLNGVFLDAPGRLENPSSYPASKFVYGLDGSHSKTLESLREFSGFPGLITLWVRNCPRLSSLEGIGEFKELKRINVEGCRNLEHVDECAALGPIELLDIQGTGVRSLTGLSGHPVEVLNVGNSYELRRLTPGLEVQRLHIGFAPELTQFDDLASGKIQELFFSAHDKDAAVPLPDCLSKLTIVLHGGLPVLSGGEALRELAIWGRGFLRPEFLPPFPLLERLSLGYVSLPGDSRIELESFPSLSRVSVRAPRGGEEIELPGFERVSRSAGLSVYGRLH